MCIPTRQSSKSTQYTTILFANLTVTFRMLYEFHKSQNGKRPGAVHATYIVYGIKNAETVKNGTDGDIEMTSSMPDVESFDDVVPTFTLTLIQEENLKGTPLNRASCIDLHTHSLFSRYPRRI